MKKTLFTLLAMLFLGLWANVCSAQYARIEISNHATINYAANYPGPWGTMEQGDVKIVVYTDDSCTTLWTSPITVNVRWTTARTPVETSDDQYLINSGFIDLGSRAFHNDHYFYLFPLGTGTGHHVYGARPEITSGDYDILSTVYYPAN